MAFQIDDSAGAMVSDAHPHAATRIPRSVISWHVTWLYEDMRLTRNQAITAMVLADTVAAEPGKFLVNPEATAAGSVPVRREPARNEPLWAHIAGWAAELGVDALGAVAMVISPRKWDPDPAVLAKMDPHAGTARRLA